MPPKCKPYLPAARYKHIVVRSVRYDGESLVVEVQGEGFAFARLVFQNPRGFRVLDELDLHEFWKDYHCKNGWLYEVEQGGWLELESTRSTFCSGQINHELLEYLIVDDKCISVFAIKPPEIFHLGTNPEQQ